MLPWWAKKDQMLLRPKGTVLNALLIWLFNCTIAWGTCHVGFKPPTELFPRTLLLAVSWCLFCASLKPCLNNTSPLYSLIICSLNVNCLNPRTCTQSYSHCGTRRLMEPIPWVFDMLQYFKTIFPSVETLWFSLQDEVDYIGGGTAGGLWCHQTWSPSRFYQELEIQ